MPYPNAPPATPDPAINAAPLTTAITVGTIKKTIPMQPLYEASV